MSNCHTEYQLLCRGDNGRSWVMEQDSAPVLTVIRRTEWLVGFLTGSFVYPLSYSLGSFIAVQRSTFFCLLLWFVDLIHAKFKSFMQPDWVSGALKVMVVSCCLSNTAILVYKPLLCYIYIPYLNRYTAIKSVKLLKMLNHDYAIYISKERMYNLWYAENVSWCFLSCT